MVRRFGVMTLVAIACFLGRAARADRAPTPAESLAALTLADPGLAIELVASEPAVEAPVAIAWDERGRLYVAEMRDYPDANTGGVIKRLEDRDGDGRYEHATVFADGLHFPNGVLPWAGGVLVTAAPDLLFLADRDGDGRADEHRVVLTGFAEGNQQLRVNSPTWGLDNWVYLANGRSGGAIRRPGDPADRAVPIPRNDLRVRPATGAFEPVAGFSQFGLPRDDWGDRFPSWNTVPLRHVVLEGEGSGAIDGRAVADILDLPDGGRIYSLAPAQRRFNAESAAYFNATCGPTILRGDALGDAYRGDAFVCEPLASVVHHRRLDPDGPTFVARRVEPGREFLASTHPWFRPVNLANGPDGALYVVDFCRAWVEHPAFVPEAQRHAVDFREGHEHGRLWRIARKGDKRPAPAWPGPEPATTQLVAGLERPSGWDRDTAQRLLTERQDRAAVAPLRELVRGSAVPIARGHALWTLDGLAALDADTLRAALKDRDARVREQAARLATGRGAECEAELISLADDPDARVRLRAALALGSLRTDAARSALARIAATDAGSPWTAAAILSALGPESGRFLAALGANPPEWLDDPTPDQARFLGRLALALGTKNEDASLCGVLDLIAQARGLGTSSALLEGLAQGQARAATPRIRWAGPLDGPLGAALARIRPVREAAPAVAADTGRPDWLRARAFGALLETDPAAAQALIRPLLDSSSAELHAAAARALARVGDRDLVASLAEGWDRRPLATRRLLIGALASKAALAGALIEAVEQEKIAAAELDAATAEALRNLADPGLRGRAAAILRAAPSGDRGALIARYEPALAEGADAARGRSLFARHCQGCHARNGQGARVGPDLISVAGRPAADLLVAILDPSREVAPDGQGVVVATADGRVLSGLLVEETPTAVRLRRAEGIEDVVPRGEIDALRPTGRSLMLDGLEQDLTPRDVADLIAFLRSNDPPGGR